MQLGRSKLMAEVRQIPADIRTEIQAVSESVSRAAVMHLVAFTLVAAVAVAALLMAVTKEGTR